MVRDDLLVVEPEKNDESVGRLNSNQIYTKLADMLHNCEEHESYACKPAPRSRKEHTVGAGLSDVKGEDMDYLDGYPDIQRMSI